MSLALAPQQQRSRRSRERMLDAAERLLEERNFEDISIAEIAAAAGTSVGNFYARFRSKEALFGALQERYEADRGRAWRAFFDDPKVAEMDLSACVRALTNSVLQKFRARHGVLRTLIIRHWRNPEEMDARSHGLLRGLYEDAFDLLRKRRDEIRHPDPERAIRIGFGAMLAAVRENVVLRPAQLPGSLVMSDEELAGELADMLLAYLTAPPAAQRGSGGD